MARILICTHPITGHVNPPLEIARTLAERGHEVRFYTGKMFPAAARNAIFVARHGSWNRTRKVGGDVMLVKLNKDGTMKSAEPFLTGFVEENKYVGRPVDVLQMKDGSLLVSDDWNGAVYRITYGKQRVADKQ